MGIDTLKYIYTNTGCSLKNGTQANGYKTVAILSNRLKLGDHKVEGFYDTPTKNQENRWNISVFFRLFKKWGVSGGQMQIMHSFCVILV